MFDKLTKYAEGIYRFLAHIKQVPLEIALPHHLYIPRDAESVDIRELCNVAALTTTPLRLLTVNAGKSDDFVFTHYALFTDAELADDVEWFFKLNGKRMLRFHGRPNDRFNPTRYALNIGVAPDISDISLIPSFFRVKPGDTLTVDVVNRNAEVVFPLGVRLKGYLNTVNSKKETTIR